MPSDPAVQLRAATAGDEAFIVEMARHACVIEDWPLPDPDDEEVLSMLPPPGEVVIIAEDPTGVPAGAVWTVHNDPPLRVDAAGVSMPELCIGVAPGRRGAGTVVCCWTRCSPAVQRPWTRCAPTCMYATLHNTCTNAKAFRWSARGAVRSG